MINFQGCVMQIQDNNWHSSNYQEGADQVDSPVHIESSSNHLFLWEERNEATRCYGYKRRH